MELFGHGFGQGHRLAEFLEQVVGVQLDLFVERLEEGADDRLFDLGAAEVLAGVDEGIEVEGIGVAAAFGEVDAEDVAAFLGGGEVDEEDFVEASLAEQFRGQFGDIVGGGDDEDGGGFFGEPGEEGAEDTGGGAAVGGAGAAGAGEGFVDFVDPEDGGGDGFGDGDGTADVFLGGSDEGAEHAAHVEAEEG